MCESAEINELKKRIDEADLQLHLDHEENQHLQDQLAQMEKKQAEATTLTESEWKFLQRNMLAQVMADEGKSPLIFSDYATAMRIFVKAEQNVIQLTGGSDYEGL